MTKPLVVFGRPHQWNSMMVEKSIFEWLPIFGKEPKLRNGNLMHDAVGGVLDPAGMEFAIQYFERKQPQVFLYWPMYIEDGTKEKVKLVVEFLDRLKKASPKTIFVYGNGNQQGQIDFNVQAFLPFIDVILTNTRDSREFETYRGAGIKRIFTFYQFGFDEIEHGKWLNETPEFDCFFGGSQTHGQKKLYPNSKLRFDFLNAIDHRFRLLVHGNGHWPFPSKPYIYGSEFYRAYNRAHINLGFNHWNLYRYYTRRTIYALASGRLYIVRYIPGMEKDFDENGVAAVWFETVEEGIERIEFYLRNQKIANRIGLLGRRLAYRQFSWTSLMLQFEQLVINQIL